MSPQLKGLSIDQALALQLPLSLSLQTEVTKITLVTVQFKMTDSPLFAERVRPQHIPDVIAPFKWLRIRYGELEHVS